MKLLEPARKPTATQNWVPRCSTSLQFQLPWTTNLHRADRCELGVRLFLVSSRSLRTVNVGCLWVGLVICAQHFSDGHFTASWTPLKHGKPCASTSIRLSSPAGRPTFISRGNALYFTRDPASRQIRASVFSIVEALFRMRPVRLHPALWCPLVSKGSEHPSHLASLMGNGSPNRSNNNTRNKCGGMVNSGAVGA